MSEYKLLTLRQASAMLQRNDRDIRQLLSDGYLPGYKLGQGWRISLDDLNSFIRKYGNLSRDQFPSINAASRSNGVQQELNAPRPREAARSTGATKTINGTRENHNNHAHCGSESSWVPPWREDGRKLQ
jgi:excisionase family DNA binding protein